MTRFLMTIGVGIGCWALSLPAAKAEAGDEARTRALEAASALTTNDPQGWFAPPKRSRQITGMEDVTVNYSKKIIQEPIWEYETVEVYRDVREGDSASAAVVRKKVTERRPLRQTGTRDVEKLVRDPNGTITQTEKRPVYGPGGPDVWRLGNLGHNAFMAAALLRAGVDPSSEELAKVLTGLSELYTRHGLPDTTWDLAWSAIAFARAGGTYRPLAEQAAGKLLDGQITDGPAAGLWGPVCINTKLLAALLEERTKLSDDYFKAKSELAKTKSAQQRMDQAQAALQGFEPLVRQVSSIELSQTVGTFRLFKTDEGDTFYTPVLPHYPYNQTSADLESTAIAVLALRIAVETKSLPAQLWRPKGLQWQRLGPPPMPATLLNRTLSVLAAAQQKEGTWTQMNLHQPVNDFAKVKGLEGVPVKADSFVALPSPVTATSTAQGYSCLVNLGRLLGGTQQLAARLRAAETALRPQLDKLEAGTLGDDAGGLVSPHEIVFWLSDVAWGGTAEESAAWRARMEKWLLAQQGSDGLWAVKWPTLFFLPTSLAERMKVLPTFLGGVPGKLPLGVAHVPWGGKQNGWVLKDTVLADSKVLASAYALYALGPAVVPAAPGKP